MHTSLKRPGHSTQTALAITILALGAMPWSASAQFEITTGTGSTGQMFDSLEDTTTSGATTIPFTSDTTLTPGDSTLEGWSLFSSDAVTPIAGYRVNTGASNAGAIYSFGVSDVPERALGGIGSAGLPLGYIAFAATNNSTSNLASFTLGFDGEQWRNGGATAPAVSGPQTMNFEYGFGATFDAVTTWNAPGGAFNWTSPVTGTSAGAAVDGNVAGLAAGRGGTINGQTWASGTTLWLRWIETNDAGNDHGLAIDNFTFSWLAGTPPKNLTWTAAINNVWDTTTGNWQDSVPVSSTFTDGDAVTFGDTGVGQVAVQDAGVAPSSTAVTNTTGTYIFRNGPINGSGSLTKTGAGTLLLNAANGYSGGTVINAGTVQVSDDVALGGGPLTLGGGTLQTVTNGITSARAVNVNAGGAIDTNGFNSTFSGSVTVNDGVLTKAGGGDLRLTGPLNMSATTSLLAISGGSVTLAQPATPNPQVFVNVGLEVLNGDLVIDTPIRLNVNRGTSSGTGDIRVAAHNATIAQTGQGIISTIGNDLVLNSTNAAAPFVTNINTTAGNMLTIDGVISGNADVNFATSATSGGAGTLILNKVNTYMGTTFFNQSAAGFVQLGIDNALPTGTDVIFGTNTGTTPGGGLDLNGFDQTIASLSSGATGTAGAARITNNSATENSVSVLTIAGTATAPETFAGVIGDGFNGGKLTLTKASTNTLTITGPEGQPQFFSGLNVNAGTLNLNSEVESFSGTNVSVAAGATLNVGADQIYASLNIASGAVVAITSSVPPPVPGLEPVAVPEPSAVALLAGSALALLGRRRRVPPAQRATV